MLRNLCDRHADDKHSQTNTYEEDAQAINMGGKISGLLADTPEPNQEPYIPEGSVGRSHSNAFWRS